MSFPDPDSLRGSIADLRDIISRAHGDNAECERLLFQIESTVSEIELKAKAALPPILMSTSTGTAVLR